MRSAKEERCDLIIKDSVAEKRRQTQASCKEKSKVSSLRKGVGEHCKSISGFARMEWQGPYTRVRQDPLPPRNELNVT